MANRGNNRIDVYDQDGKLLRQWTQFGKSGGLFIEKNDITLFRRFGVRCRPRHGPLSAASISPGLARYTINNNTIPTNSQGMPAGGRAGAGGRGGGQ